jgi:hypothetical protein
MSGSPATRGLRPPASQEVAAGRVSKHGAGDLPITNGLQECIRDFRASTRTSSCSRSWTSSPRAPLDLSLGEDTEARLPAIVGGLSVALARAEEPRTEHWERVFRVFHLVL